MDSELLQHFPIRSALQWTPQETSLLVTQATIVFVWSNQMVLLLQLQEVEQVALLTALVQMLDLTILEAWLLIDLVISWLLTETITEFVKWVYWLFFPHVTHHGTLLLVLIL